MTYSEKLKDPRWQKKRLEILSRDEFTCQNCHDTKSTLHVHHKNYFAAYDPWDYEVSQLITLCESCHEAETNANEFRQFFIKSAAKSFSNFSIKELAEGFENIKIVHLPEVVASSLAFVLADENEMKLLVDRYFKHLQKETKKSGK